MFTHLGLCIKKGDTVNCAALRVSESCIIGSVCYQLSIIFPSARNLIPSPVSFECIIPLVNEVG